MRCCIIYISAECREYRSFYCWTVRSSYLPLRRCIHHSYFRRMSRVSKFLLLDGTKLVSPVVRIIIHQSLNLSTLSQRTLHSQHQLTISATCLGTRTCIPSMVCDALIIKCEFRNNIFVGIWSHSNYARINNSHNR